VYPHRRWFLKIDADTLVLPVNLLRFLQFLDHEVADASSTPIYFGSHQGAITCREGDQGNVCKASVFKRGAGPNGGRGHTTYLRDTKHWRTLEQEFLGHDEHDNRWNARNRTHAVTYAWGGAYGMSRAAAERMVRSSCVWRVGTLPCHGHGLGNGCTYNQHGIGLNTREDAAVGLCMHLIAAQLVHCACFHSGRVDRVWGVVPWIVSHAVGKLMVNGSFRGDISHEDRMRKIHHVFNDAVPAGSEIPGNTFLCKHPIALHAIRSPETEYLPLWEMLTMRDQEHAEELKAWRRNASASRPPRV
jgi:hypothetical protein